MITVSDRMVIDMSVKRPLPRSSQRPLSRQEPGMDGAVQRAAKIVECSVSSIKYHFFRLINPFFRVCLGDSCYFVSPTADLKDWNAARQTCRQIYQHPTDRTRSSDLVSIHDQLENDFVFSLMGDKVNRWTGLHEDWDRRTMFWSDNTPYNFNYWAAKEPLYNPLVIGDPLLPVISA